MRNGQIRYFLVGSHAHPDAIVQIVQTYNSQHWTHLAFSVNDSNAVRLTRQHI